MSACTLREILFHYEPPKPKTRVFMMARRGGEKPQVGDKILGWAEVTDAFVPGTLKLVGSSPTDPSAPFANVFGDD